MGSSPFFWFVKFCPGFLNKSHNKTKTTLYDKINLLHFFTTHLKNTIVTQEQCQTNAENILFPHWGMPNCLEETSKAPKTLRRRERNSVAGNRQGF